MKEETCRFCGNSQDFRAVAKYRVQRRRTLNLNIKDIDPETRGLLYRLQAEQNKPNLAETLKYLVANYYAKPTKPLGSELCVCGHTEAAHDGDGCLGNGATCDCKEYRKAASEQKQG